MGKQGFNKRTTYMDLNLFPPPNPSMQCIEVLLMNKRKAVKSHFSSHFRAKITFLKAF